MDCWGRVGWTTEEAEVAFFEGYHYRFAEWIFHDDEAGEAE